MTLDELEAEHKMHGSPDASPDYGDTYYYKKVRALLDEIPKLLAVARVAKGMTEMLPKEFGMLERALKEFEK